MAPQLAIVAVFFYLPAGQALYQSVFIQDAFGLSSEFVGLENFRDVLADESYLNALQVTAVFSALVTAIGLSVSLVLAYFADRAVRGALVFRTLLITSASPSSNFLSISAICSLTLSSSSISLFASL